MMINRLKGKRAVVTGATARIVDELPIDKSKGILALKNGDCLLLKVLSPMPKVVVPTFCLLHNNYGKSW